MTERGIHQRFEAIARDAPLSIGDVWWEIDEGHPEPWVALSAGGVHVVNLPRQVFLEALEEAAIHFGHADTDDDGAALADDDDNDAELVLA
jgi:hypothetical protein